jgi:hypothetical protein
MDCLHMKVPRDPEDKRYSVSFDHRTAAQQVLEFFETFGFVVWREIFTAEECVRTRNAMWDGLTQLCPGLDADDPRTWDNFKSSGTW